MKFTIQRLRGRPPRHSRTASRVCLVSGNSWATQTWGETPVTDGCFAGGHILSGILNCTGEIKLRFN
jgi:hypothetical protein